MITRASTLEHNLLIIIKNVVKEKRGISIKEIIREVHIKWNLKPLFPM